MFNYLKILTLIIVSLFMLTMQAATINVSTHLQNTQEVNSDKTTYHYDVSNPLFFYDKFDAEPPTKNEPANLADDIDSGFQLQQTLSRQYNYDTVRSATVKQTLSLRSNSPSLLCAPRSHGFLSAYSKKMANKLAQGKTFQANAGHLIYRQFAEADRNVCFTFNAPKKGLKIRIQFEERMDSRGPSIGWFYNQSNGKRDPI